MTYRPFSRIPVLFQRINAYLSSTWNIGVEYFSKEKP